MHRTTSPVRTRTRHRVLCSFHMLRLMIHTRPCRTMGLAGISIIPKRFDPTHQVRISARSNMPQPLGRSIRPVSVPQSNYISGRHSSRSGTVYLSRDRRGAPRPMGRAGQPDVRLLERRPMPPLGHFSLIRFARVARQAPSAGTRGVGDGKLA
jgi:hypothetical protein